MMMAVKRPLTARTHSCSNVVSCSLTAIVDNTTPATPPWLIDRLSVPAATRGRGRSITLNQADRRRPKTTLSVSCHVSVRHSRSTRSSRHSPTISSNLDNTDRTFRHPKVTDDRAALKSIDDTVPNVTAHPSTASVLCTKSLWHRIAV